MKPSLVTLFFCLLLPQISFALPDASSFQSDLARITAPVLKIPYSAPSTPEEVASVGTDLLSAIVSKRWWLSAALGIFLAMFILNTLKVWERVGTRWAWFTVGILTLLSGTFSSFESGGFNWGSFLGYLTAGPTIAWVRDFIKDGLTLQKKENP